MKRSPKDHRPRRRALLAAVVTGLLAAVLTACGGSASGGSASGGDDDRYTIVLSNNNASQSWRQQMMNGMQHVADTVFADKVDYEAKVSEESASAQAASLQQIVRERPDAILVDAISPTALNGVLQQACDAGIVVVNFDQTVEGLDCAYKPHFDDEGYAEDAANFMCAQLGGSGRVLLDQAIAGLPATDRRTQVTTETLAANCPGVEIVATYQSQYQPGAEAEAVGALLASEPQVDGVLSLAYCSSVVQAFERAGRPLVPMTCVAANNNAIACEEAGVPCFMWGNPPLIGSIALDLAVDILEGGEAQEDFVAFGQTYFLNEYADFEKNIEPIELVSGENFFPDESPELILPVTHEDFGITPQAALTGN